jgi:hypothetical protein
MLTSAYVFPVFRSARRYLQEQSRRRAFYSHNRRFIPDPMRILVTARIDSEGEAKTSRSCRMQNGDSSQHATTPGLG